MSQRRLVMDGCNVVCADTGGAMTNDGNARPGKPCIYRTPEPARTTHAVGDSLRRAYQETVDESVPEQLRELLNRLDQ